MDRRDFLRVGAASLIAAPILSKSEVLAEHESAAITRNEIRALENIHKSKVFTMLKVTKTGEKTGWPGAFSSVYRLNASPFMKHPENTVLLLNVRMVRNCHLLWNQYSIFKHDPELIHTSLEYGQHDFNQHDWGTVICESA